MTNLYDFSHERGQRLRVGRRRRGDGGGQETDIGGASGHEDAEERGGGNKDVYYGRQRVQVLLDVVGLKVCEVDGVENEETGGVRGEAADDELFAAGDAGTLGAETGVSKKTTEVWFFFPQILGMLECCKCFKSSADTPSYRKPRR